MAALGIGPGDEVVVPALTFFATASAVIHQGAVPVFCDISLDNYCMDPQDMERRVTPRTKAVVPVHYLGHAAEMDAINAIAARRGIAVVEDCAQAHGTTYRGQKVGSLGEMGAFSFFATKHMTTGEGGAVTTNNARWAETLRLFRSHGLRGRNDHVMLGYNYRMTEMAAAIGIVQLGKLESLNDARIRNSQYLAAKLDGIPWLTLPQVPAHVRHTYFWCHVLVNEERLGFDTRELARLLRENGVEVRERYVAPLYRQAVLTENLPALLRLSGGAHLPRYGEMHLPNAERVAGRLIGLPNRPDMTEDELDRVVEVVREVPYERPERS
jgi:dTDP-4-amino-4,6-dideoxygalactose transaminase